MNKSNILISLLLVLISLTWAGSFIAVKVTVDEISPIDLGFLRFFVATPFMVLILFLRKKDMHIPAKELPSLSILGLTGVTLLYIFQYTGIEYTTASTSSVLINVNVIFIALLSVFFLKEKFSIIKTLGVAISFFGVIVVILSQTTNEAILFNNIFLVGSIFVILSAFCWAVYSIVGKKLLTRYDPFTVTTYAFVLGTVFYLPVVLPDILPVIQNISFNGWLAVFYLALFCSVFGYVAWYYALSKTEASRAAVFLNLIPLFTIALSFFIKEIPTILFLIGAILIIYGVYLTQKS
jgi:drug/metabolite transporter (DMT)-like permease